VLQYKQSFLTNKNNINVAVFLKLDWLITDIYNFTESRDSSVFLAFNRFLTYALCHITGTSFRSKSQRLDFYRIHVILVILYSLCYKAD
jgi:hypothetical protein